MLCTGLGIGLITITEIAGADEAAHQDRIPAQSLDSSLLRLAADSGLEILFTADKVRGVTSNPVDGNLTPAQALSQLLQGSGMTYRFVDAKTVTVEQPTKVEEKAEPQSGGDTTFPKVTVEADAGYDPDWETSPYNTDYNRTVATTAAKTDTPMMETPISIQVIPKAVMHDQQAIQVGDAIKNVTGLVQGFSFGGFSETFYIRGFDARNTNYLDGFRWPVSRIPLANAERIEVVKGAAVNLY